MVLISGELSVILMLLIFFPFLMQNIPTIVFEIENLQILKLRNNPIREIPYEIGQLTRLRTLVLSFCILSDLPPT